MAHCYARDFTLDIFPSCPAVQAERGDETATYHPGETLSGFLKITSRVNIVFEDVFITLEGIVRIWESSPALENELLAVQHRVISETSPAFAIQQRAKARNYSWRYPHDPVQF